MAGFEASYNLQHLLIFWRYSERSEHAEDGLLLAGELRLKLA